MDCYSSCDKGQNISQAYWTWMAWPVPASPASSCPLSLIMSAFQPHRLSRFLWHLSSNYLHSHHRAFACAALFTSHALHTHLFNGWTPLTLQILDQVSLPPHGHGQGSLLHAHVVPRCFLSEHSSPSVYLTGQQVPGCFTGLFVVTVVSLTLRRQNGDQLVIDNLRLWS